MDQATPETVRTDFIEAVGIIAQADGLPRIAGRLFGLLVFDGGRHAFGDLADALQVSRGSISSSARLLEEKGLIKRVSVPGDRQDYFELADDPYSNLLDGVATRAARAQAEISKTMAQLSPGHAAIPRLKDYFEFYAAIRGCVGNAIPTMEGLDNVEDA